MVEQYLEDRPQLKLVVLIVDLRRGLEGEEEELLEWLVQRGIRCCIAATKADKLNRTERARAAQAIQEQVRDLDAQLIEFSSESGEGREEVWSIINQAVKLGEVGEDAIQD